MENLHPHSAEAEPGRDLVSADASYDVRYRDYPISRQLFHRESQSTTSVESKTGQRYLSGTSTPMSAELFVDTAAVGARERGWTRWSSPCATYV